MNVRITLLNRTGWYWGPRTFFRATLIGLLLTIPFVSSSPVSAETPKSGSITADETWTVANSPYTITGHVTVASGVTLTIDPGVTVKVDSGRIVVIEGTLVARGTSGNGIIFTSSAASPAAGDWGYIKFNGSSPDASFDSSGNYLSGSILEYTSILYGGGNSGSQTPFTDSGAVIASNTSPFISNSTIRYSSRQGVNLNPGFDIPPGALIGPEDCSHGLCGSSIRLETRFTNNTISDSVGIGLELIAKNGDMPASPGGNITISGNTFTNSRMRVETHNRIYDPILTEATTYITGNTVSSDGFGNGIYAIRNGEYSSTVISQNEVSNSGTGLSVASNVDSYTTAQGHLSITNNLIKDNQLAILAGYELNGSISISSNKIINNGGGIRLGFGESMTITNNILHGNGGGVIGICSGGHDGVWPDVVPSVTLTGNSITGTTAQSVFSIGQTCGSTPNLTIENNNILYTNSSYWITAVNTDGAGSFTLANNWWGTTNNTEIQTKTFDWNQDPSTFLVTYAPVLSAPSTTAPPAPPTTVSAQTGPTSIAFSWSANSELDIAGYKLYYDTDAAGYPYANTIDLGNVTSYTLTGLSTGTPYYTAISAYDGDGNTSWVSTNVTATPLPPPTILMFSTQPVGAVAGGTFTTLPVITLQDLFGNTGIGSSDTVTLSITSGTGTAGASLSGTTIVNALAGVARFPDIRIDTAGTGYTLTASSPGFISAFSNVIVISAGAPNKLVFTTQPVGGFVDVPFDVQPTVLIQNDSGNTLTSATNAVTLVITPGTSKNPAAQLLGTTTVNAVNGVASFTDLKVDQAGPYYTLTATSGNHASATSISFATVNFGAAPALGQTVLWIFFGAFAVMFIVLMIRRRSITDQVPD